MTARLPAMGVTALLLLAAPAGGAGALTSVPTVGKPCTPARDGSVVTTRAGLLVCQKTTTSFVWRRLDMVLGSAVAGGGHHLRQSYADPFPNDQTYRRILARDFGSVTPENQMKWDFIHPGIHRYHFAPADAIVRFARKNRQRVRGHTLLAQGQNPQWLETGNFTPEELRAILRDHVRTVVGHYKGKVQEWDVANEVIGGDGAFRTDNIFVRVLGPEIIASAFRWAHEADPNALLFFNDNAVESIGPKSDAYYAYLQKLLAEGVPVRGFAMQGHLTLQDAFPADVQQNLQRFADLGLVTALSEVDVRIVLPESGRPSQAQLEQQADYYKQLLEACLKVRRCRSFTIWGFPDKYSWVPTSYEGQGAATVMWDDFTKKPAYDALWSALGRTR